MNNKIDKKIKTLSNLKNSINVSKIKVLSEISKTRDESKEAYNASMFSAKVFEVAYKNYGFSSIIYKNKKSSKKGDIYVAFINNSYGIGDTSNKILTKLSKIDSVKNTIIIIGDNKKLNDNYTYYDNKKLNEASIALMYMYSSNEYNSLKIFDNTKLSEKVILPTNKLVIDDEFDLPEGIKFLPTIESVIEMSFSEYILNFLQYFSYYIRNLELKNSLIRFESSLDTLDDKINTYKEEIIKEKKAKETEEILSSFDGGFND